MRNPRINRTTKLKKKAMRLPKERILKAPGPSSRKNSNIGLDLKLRGVFSKKL
jgi:hypothetical protein